MSSVELAQLAVGRVNAISFESGDQLKAELQRVEIGDLLRLADAVGRRDVDLFAAAAIRDEGEPLAVRRILRVSDRARGRR